MNRVYQDVSHFRMPYKNASIAGFGATVLPPDLPAGAPAAEDKIMDKHEDGGCYFNKAQATQAVLTLAGSMIAPVNADDLPPPPPPPANPTEKQVLEYQLAYADTLASFLQKASQVKLVAITAAQSEEYKKAIEKTPALKKIYERLGALKWAVDKSKAGALILAPANLNYPVDGRIIHAIKKSDGVIKPIVDAKGVGHCAYGILTLPEFSGSSSDSSSTRAGLTPVQMGLIGAGVLGAGLLAFSYFGKKKGM